MVIKQYLIELPILASPGADDTLYLYLAISKASVSAALFKEDENKKQRPILFVSKSLSEAETRYAHLEQAALALLLAAKQRPILFVSKSLSEAETRYAHLEQAALALLVAAKKDYPYFQAHPIIVLTNFPLRNTIHKPNLL